MSETGGTDAAEPFPAPDGRSDQEYFQAIEATFLRLRGSPLLLSPKDWQTAQEWHRQGVPIELVERTLEEVFERRRERGDERKISSLRYCARPVEAAWKQLRELTAPGDRASAGEAGLLEVAPRLAALAAALPEALPERGAVAARIRALAGHDDPRRVEEGLGELEARLLDDLLAALPAKERAAIEAQARESLAPLAERMTREGAERARERLVRQKLRRRTGLPTLSLFAPEAEPPAEPPAESS
jgi:hypothetical protein